MTGLGDTGLNRCNGYTWTEKYTLAATYHKLHVKLFVLMYPRKI